MEILRTEHPNPQWKRDDWKNLNGIWEFDFDFGRTAREREMFKCDKLDKKILVPFCPESKLSGIEYKDFINGVCYRREFELSESEINKRTILHFGASDFKTYIYINKEYVGMHTGGYAAFEFDISKYVKCGTNTLFVIVEDDVRTGNQPRGKQSIEYISRGCAYSRTTGIWQTVWLEFVNEKHIIGAKYYPDIKNGILNIDGQVAGDEPVVLEASFEGRTVGKVTAEPTHGKFYAQLKLDEVHLWEVGNGQLYDLTLTCGDDLVHSYFGMRNVSIENKKFCVNGKVVFQRLVLDQGFYPDGICTAKTEGDLIKDIELSMAAGFNGARLHQKVFEPLFLYHCDRLGYMVWDEGASYRMDCRNKYAAENFTSEWMEILQRDFNHPAVIGWCPFNESWDYEEIKLEDRTIELNYKMTKMFDTTRPCIDTSGHYHVITDIYDTHDYDQDVENFAKNVGQLEREGTLHEGRFEGRQFYNGEPTFMSEYGGIKWNKKALDDGLTTSWGYGVAPESEEEFIARYKGLTDALLDAPDMIGFCYTQLYDVEQEMNGLYTYEREPKFDIEIFRKINTRKAKIEE